MGMVHGLQRLLVGKERALARSAQHVASLRLSPSEREERVRFLNQMEGEPGPRRVALGRWQDEEGTARWVGLPPERLFKSHAWITGATGSGKSFFVLGMLLQILRQNQLSVIVVDLKGELSQLLRDVVLPALSVRNSSEDLLSRLRVIRPFDRDFLPALRVTAPEEGVSREIQAHAIASSLEDALGEPLGARMNRIFLKLTTLAIERNRPLTDVLSWLESPEALSRAARESNDPGLRAYAARGFARENKQTLEALLSRLDTFLFLKETRLALSAESCVSFQDCLASGVTIVDVGDPPAGAERVARFWAGVLAGRLTRAILSRKVNDQSQRALVIWEEFQEALGKSQTEQFGRLLALARYKKVSLWFVNQQPSQVAAHEPALVRALRTNTGLEAAFRCNLEDAKALAHTFHVPENKTLSEARQDLLQRLTRLPDREYLLWLKQASFGAQSVRSPRIDLPGLKALAGRCPDDVKQRIRQGTAAVARAELEARITGAHDPADLRLVVPDEEDDVEESMSSEVPFLG